MNFPYRLSARITNIGRQEFRIGSIVMHAQLPIGGGSEFPVMEDGEP